MNNALADLDELVLRCRDKRAREYIAEAINCYRAGAYRSSIVATWVAVCYDIIDKLRELSLAGDKAAEGIVEGIEKTRKADDIVSALKFERELLKIARDRFELVSPPEFDDLVRLQEDRNRCAHPSLISEDQGFDPSGELARWHIRSAVTHLLQHPPVQGKYALDRLLRQVDSEYFPTEIPEATDRFATGPLKRPRESLVRNFIVVLLKRALETGPDWEWQSLSRVYAALGAVRALHVAIFEACLAEKLPSLLRQLSDDELYRGIAVFRRVPDCWKHLPPDLQNHFENFVRGLPPKHLDELDFLLEYPPLKEKAAVRLSLATRQELRDTAFWDLPMQVADRFVSLYLESKNFAEANDWAKQISLNAWALSVSQQRTLIAGISKNDEVLHSFEVGTVIKHLRQTKKIPPALFESLLTENGLDKFALSETGEA